MKTLLLFFACLVCTTAVFSQKYYLFVGTYTDSGSKGIYVYNFDAATGRATWVSNTDGVINPSFLTISHNQQYVYSVTESARNSPGSVSAFSFDKKTGQLHFINKQTSGGANPCYVSIHKNDRWVTVANYTGGSVSVYPVHKDGSVQPLAQNIQHSGSSVNKQRQDKPHVHASVFSPDYKYLMTPDLGTDKINIYRFDVKSQRPLSHADPAFTTSEPGNGPRHLAFHPSKKYAYLIEEMSGTVAVFSYKKGTLKFLQRTSSHPADFKGAKGSADIHVSPDGKFLYATNRGDANTIAWMKINDDGSLATWGQASTLGRTPRNFIIEPSGKYVLVANQNTHNIVVFKRDENTGALTATGEQIKVPSPVCLQMMEQ